MEQTLLITYLLMNYRDSYSLMTLVRSVCLLLTGETGREGKYLFYQPGSVLDMKTIEVKDQKESFVIRGPKTKLYLPLYKSDETHSSVHLERGE